MTNELFRVISDVLSSTRVLACVRNFHTLPVIHVLSLVLYVHWVQLSKMKKRIWNLITNCGQFNLTLSRPLGEMLLLNLVFGIGSLLAKYTCLLQIDYEKGLLSWSFLQCTFHIWGKCEANYSSLNQDNLTLIQWTTYYRCI